MGVSRAASDRSCIEWPWLARIHQVFVIVADDGFDVLQRDFALKLWQRQDPAQRHVAALSHTVRQTVGVDAAPEQLAQLAAQLIVVLLFAPSDLVLLVAVGTTQTRSTMFHAGACR